MFSSLALEAGGTNLTTMKLSDYVHGSIPQPHDRPVSRGTHKNGVPSSRLRAAELARVSVPPTRLNGFSASATVNVNGNKQLQQSRGVGRQHMGVTSPVQSEHRDMFDTDIEGIDDSTTTMSLMRDDDPQPPQIERLASPRRGRDNGSAPNRGDMPLQALSGAFEHQSYSISDRMKELDSEPDDDANVAFQDLYDQDDERNNAQDMEAEEGEPTIKLGWDSGRGDSQKAMSWQQIEAALREQNSESASDDYGAQRTAEYNATQELENGFQNNTMGQQQQTNYGDVSHVTPQPKRKLIPSGRFTPRSRFSTPKKKPPTPFSISRIPRPVSAQGASFGSDQALSPLNSEYNRNQLPPSPSQTHTNDGYHNHHQGGGMFDTTDLSALDTSEESITDLNPPATATSPQLSTLSPVSSKRPFNAFTSDYHPNILRSKSFSDLHAEPFDYNPAPPPPVFPTQDQELPLAERLQLLKTLTDDQRRTFFSSLTLTEWEDSGDWLIEQFGVILQRTKDARRERRQVAGVFEAEIKRRYDLVEEEAKDIRQRMEDMRAGGMGVLKGRSQ